VRSLYHEGYAVVALVVVVVVVVVVMANDHPSR
jgi:hypothetical protein